MDTPQFHRSTMGRYLAAWEHRSVLGSKPLGCFGRCAKPVQKVTIATDVEDLKQSVRQKMSKQTYSVKDVGVLTGSEPLPDLTPNFIISELGEHANIPAYSPLTWRQPYSVFHLQTQTYAWKTSCCHKELCWFG